jgi:hypothetical protein
MTPEVLAAVVAAQNHSLITLSRDKIIPNVPPKEDITRLAVRTDPGKTQ